MLCSHRHQKTGIFAKTSDFGLLNKRYKRPLKSKTNLKNTSSIFLLTNIIQKLTLTKLGITAKERHTDRQKECQTERVSDRLIYGWTDRGTDRRTDGLTGGRMEGQTDRQTKTRHNVFSYTHTREFKKVKYSALKQLII